MYGMTHDKSFTKDQINKIGNAIIYLSKAIPELGKTKILKLLFLLEEACIRKYGHPFFGIDFQLWKHGPVAKDIFIDLSYDSPTLLAEFIEKDNQNSANFIAKKEFCDDEFSDNDIAIMDAIIEFSKDKPATYLVKHTHGKNSLWRKSAIKYGVLDILESELKNSTEYEVDFSLLFENSPYLKERFEDAKENMEVVRQLKS